MTNRTKTDWAYKKAEKLQQAVMDHLWFTPLGHINERKLEDRRMIAAALRRAYQKGLHANG